MTTTEEIWYAYQSRIRGFIRARIDDASHVDDLMQEIFIKIHSGLDYLNDDERMGSWLFQITRNAIRDYYRCRKSSHPFDESLMEVGDDTVKQARRELEACLLPMVEDLPETYREAVRLSEVDGLTQEAVAAKLGLSLSGAKSRVQRGRQLIRGILESCCQFEFDHRGHLVDYDKKNNGNSYC